MELGEARACSLVAEGINIGWLSGRRCRPSGSSFGNAGGGLGPRTRGSSQPAGAGAPVMGEVEADGRPWEFPVLFLKGASLCKK